MLKLSTARRAACSVLLALVALPSWAQTNRAPQIDSQPERLATVKLGFHYAVRATDADGDTLRYLLPTAPVGATINADSGVVQWRPQATDIGRHAFRVAVEDGKSGRAEQPFELKVVEDYCQIYPIALPKASVDGLSPGALINQLERGTGPGNFSWLTWTGANDAPTMAGSLTPPGDSDTYVDPDDASDRLLNIADWAQGSPGSMNSNAIRDAMDVLKTIDIILPVWDGTRGQGSRFDYRVQRFVTVRLRDYRLTGNGWLTVEYKGEATCYNYAPSALPQTLTTREDTPLPITLTGTDPDGDALTYTVLTAPAHGTLSGSAPNVIYTPAPNYHGADAFTFRVNDGRFDSAPATIDLTVTPLNDPPLANPQTLTTVEDTPLPIVLTGSDIENDALTYTVLQAPAHGTLSGSAPNLTYTPTTNYHGPDAFTFRVNDGALNSAAATVSITVTPVNDAPIAQDQRLETPRDTALPIALTGSDPDGDALQFTVVDAPAHGALSGTAPSLTFTPTAGFHGEDRFTFRVNDGALNSPLATVFITITRGNEAPKIVSPPVTVATEALAYRYDVDATDPDNDTLAYSLDRTPDALAINSASGVIGGVVDASLVQPVRTFNGQCYVLPDDAELEDPDGTIIAPLFQRVRRAITKGSNYAAPQTRAWHQRHGCLGCHVQNQTLLGLQGSMERAKVDEDTAEYLLAEILASQQSDGSIRRSHPEFSGNQTAFALWALSYVPDHARTLSARERALRFFLPRRQTSGSQTYWNHDHPSGWLNMPEAATALVTIGIDRFVRDAARLQNVTPAQVALALELRGRLPGVAEYFLARSTTTNNNITLAFTMLGLAQTQPHVDAALRARVDERLALLNTGLRERSRATGGWSHAVSGAADPLTSAWVGFALDTLDPPLTDPVVVNNIKYLLDAQVAADGTWRTTSSLFGTHLATTGLVMAYLPIALEHLGNPDLTLGHMKLEEQVDGRFVLSVEAMNRGLADVNVASTVRFYTGREAAGTLLGDAVAATLRSGETRWVSITLDTVPEGDVSASIAASAIDECLENNNSTRAGLTIARATDPFALFDTQPYLINLEDANAAPAITSQPVTSFEQGKPYVYQVTVSDPDVGDAHEYELRTAPAGLYINPLNGKFSYDLQELAAGTHTVTVRVTDLRGASAQQSFQLIVIPNRPPVITSTPALQATVGAAYRYDVDATDPDNDTLRYRLDGAPLTMNIDAETGVITWTPGTLHIGSQSVAVVAEDGRGGRVRQVWTITVAAVPINRAPQITTTAVTSATVGAEYRYDVDATDADGDVLSYTLTSAPSGMQIDSATGLIRWTPTAAVSVEVEVRVQDPRGGFALQRYTLQVAAPPNQAPTITSTAPTAATAGALYTYRVDATDADNDALTLMLLVNPAGMTLNAASAEISWTPTPAQVGSHAVHVQVSDGRGGTAMQSFNIVVSQGGVNLAPQITSAAITTATVATEYRYDVEATDGDGETLTYRLTTAPGGMQIDSASGLIRWTPTTAASVVVEVRAEDPRGGFATQRYTLQVVGPSNQSPTITSTAPTMATAGVLYRYVVDASDADNDALTIMLLVNPAGMTLNDASGEITWTPTAAQVGSHAVQVQVTDGRGGVATQSFNIVVSPAVGNQPPSIVSTPIHSAKVGREYRYALIAQDPNGDTLTYSLTTAPSGMTIAANGAIAWTPGTTGAFPVRVRVADAQAWVEQAWTITVLAADVALNAVVSISPTPVQPGGTVTIQIVVEGAAAQTTVTATLDGQPLPLDPDGSTTVTAPTAPGNHPVVVTVTDGHDTDTTTSTIVVVDPSDTVDPTAQIHSPREGATEQLLLVSSPRDVVISVADQNLRSWRLLLMERGVAGSPIELARGTTAVTQQNVAKLDPTLLVNGQYALVLNAEDVSGNTAQDIVGVSIEGAMKLGHFSITFQDLNLPVSGIPVTVARTYDTRQRHRALDFGQGWSLAYQNVRIHESRRPGFAWEFKVYPSGPLGLIPNYCMESALGNVVSVTLADGKVEKFRAKASPECNQVLPLVDVDIVFVPMPGTHGKLQALDDAGGRLINGSIAELDDPGTPIDPNNYKYIDADGVEFSLDQNFGLRKIQERTNDNTITFGRDGIVHSNGTSVSFLRNAAGRITRVTGPNATQLNYEYDASGNLTAFVDAGGNRTRYTYLAGNYLQDIIDPRGVRVSRNVYNDEGRLIAVIDADGNRIEYTRDIEGRVETVKDRNGGTTVHVYNERGDVLAETNPLNQTTHRTYDINGNELSRTDALNRTQRWTYDSLGNVLVETNAAGERTTNVYGSFNHLLTQADNSNRVVLRSTWRNITLPGTGVEVYPGPLVNVQDANGQSIGFGYDQSTGQLNRITDASGASTGFVTDAQGYRIAETDALGRRTDYVNDDLGRVIEQRRTRTKADGMSETLVTLYTYDDNGNLTETEHADGSVTRSEYDSSGNATAEIDALNRRTTREYNDRGEVAAIHYPDGTSETKTYDDNGNVLTQTDRAGRVTTFVYDAANRLTETIHPDAETNDGNDANNPRSKSLYDVVGQLVASIDENGNVTRYQYDLAGRRTQAILTAINGTTATVVDAYDTLGRRQSSTDANGHVTLYRYDAVGRLLETEHEGAISKVEYDAAGRKVADTDAQGRITRYGYDALGRLTTVVLPNPVTGANPALVAGVSPDSGTLTTRYAYDEVGNKISQTDAEGRITRWEFDVMGRETARVLPEGQRETKQYNAAGELVAHTDFNGRTTRYTYDVTGKVGAIDYTNDADVSFDYNAAGERTTVTDGRGDSTMSFDRRGRVVQSHDADGGIIEYTYDDAGNLLSRVSPSQSLVYAYDTRHRMTQVTRTVDGEMPTVTRYEYDQDGNRTAMLGGDGLRTEYSYDRRHRLTNLVKKTAVGAVLLAMQYTVDASGMRTAVEERDSLGLARTVAYSYDVTKRLTREAIDHRDADKDRISTWVYDDVGNRLTQAVTMGASTTESTTYTYDANDRLISETKTGGAQAGATVYTYDDNGNTLTKTGPTGPTGTTTYTYDDANRLIQAITPQGTTAYVYTADGLRIRQTVTPTGGTATTTWYVQDSAYPYAQVIEEYTSHGSGAKQLAATFTFADELLSQTRYDGGTPTTRFIQVDGFGSTRWLTDTTGAISDTIDYDAFGNEIGRTGTTNVEHLYRGEAFDPNVGFYYLRARYMDPSQGRFMGMDSFAGNTSDPASLHRYLYANANPVSYVDPSGMFSLMEVSVAQDIRMTLSNIQIEVGMGLLDGAMSRGETDPASYLAAGVIWGAVARIAPKAIGLFFRRGCKPNSFEGNTLVHTERGLVPIELVTEDDRVWGWNAELDREGWYEVADLVQGESQYLMVSLLLSNGEVLTATENHPFYVVNPDPARADQSVDENGALNEGPNWINAGLLKEGDLLRLRGGVFSQVVGAFKEVRSERVFNITVEDAHTYYVGEAGVLTHNIACRVPKLGGSYYDVRKAYKGQGGEVNHIPPDFATGSAISYNKGPAIFMVKDDHRQLLSTTSATHRLQQQRLIAQGKFDDAFDMDATDIQSQFGAKYDQAIDQARFYCREQGWCKR